MSTANSSAIPNSFFRGSNSEPTTTIPKAYINYIFFDEQFNYKSGGFSRVGATSGSVWDHWQNDPALQNLIAPKNGYIFVYVSNESNVDVFFDNLQVIHKPGPILEETHYYPFGLVMAGISSKAAGVIENRLKFNESTEFNTDFDINLYETSFRTYDPQIGRFLQSDPLAVFMPSRSPYEYGASNPILNNDRLGLDPETSTASNPKDLKDVTVFAIRPKPSLKFEDFLNALSPFIGPTKGIFTPVSSEATEKIYNKAVYVVSEIMPDPPIVGGEHWMHRKYRIELAKEFIREMVFSLAMLIPGLNEVALEERALALMAKEGMIAEEIVEAVHITLKLEKSVSKVAGLTYRSAGEVTTAIKNEPLLAELNAASKGDWVKVYEAGIQNGNKVELHYFRNNSTREVFDVKTKYNYWHQKQFKNLIP